MPVCVGRDRGIASFLSGSADQPVENDGQRGVFTLLTLVYSAVSAHSETILSNGRSLLPSTPMK